MSKNPIRNDKTCLNCRHVVDNRFCSNCGQENTETRKTFHHLFVHFFEDLTHYENAFWKTIRNLSFKPGSLTKEYLSGRRMSYLAPVRLYIFISFVTFLILALLPDGRKEPVKFSDSKKTGFHYSWNNEPAAAEVKKLQDSLKDKHENENPFYLGDDFYKSQRQVDSLQRYGKPEDKLSPATYWMVSKYFHVVEHNTAAEIGEKFKESLSHNFPKVLFIYMPFFAFVLWLFHNKKRWYYFDHGIFTLHYFSFLLLGHLIVSLFRALTQLLPDALAPDVVARLFAVVVYGYMFYYFFPAHHRFYGDSRRVTIAKGLAMLVINSIFAGIIMLLFVIYTFLNIK